MKHIFISHAGDDLTVAERFHSDLLNAGHDVRIDTCALKLGKNSIRFMNQGIADAQAIVILFSKHTPLAAWQEVEIEGAIWSEIQQGGAECKVIRLDDTLLPPLLGPKVFATLAPDMSNYEEVLDTLCESLLPSTTASSLVADAFRSGSHNPFRRVRAEFFEDVPKLLADAFAPPDAIKMSALEEMKPCFLEGPRGTGKSMLLLALRARNLASRRNAKPITQLFGFYLKLSRGAVCNAGIVTDPDSALGPPNSDDLIQVTDAFSQEIVLCLLESLFSEIKFCVRAGHLACDTHCEHALAARTYKQLVGTEPNHQFTIDDLLWYMAGLHRDLANFIRRKFIYRESITVPTAVLDLEMLRRIFRLARETVPALSKSVLVVLLDEYENLFPFQQKVVNGLVKLAAPDFTVKIANKLGCDEVSGTTTGQELQEIHDYNRVNLVYDVEDVRQFKLYESLLGTITERLLTDSHLAYGGMDVLLPRAPALEVDEQEWLKEIAHLHKISVETLQGMPDEQKREKISYYSQAAIYRTLYKRRGRQKDKVIASFEDLAFLSSGVIRYFLETLGVAFHLQYADSPPAAGAVGFPQETQTRAVHLVSQHCLTTLSRNVETYGERMKYYILDIGDCLRHWCAPRKLIQAL